jgi:hypothetical protein
MLNRRKKFQIAIGFGALLLVAVGIGCSGFFVNPTLTSIAVGPQASIQTGGTVQMQAVGTYNDGTQSPLSSGVYWSSSSTNIASISTKGLVTGVSVGQSTISAAASAVNGSTTVTVTLAGLTSILITPQNTAITAGSDEQYTATGTANGQQVNLNGAGELNWSIDNTDNNLIAVDNTGDVTTDSSITSQQIVHVTAQDPTTGINSNTATLTVNAGS